MTFSQLSPNAKLGVLMTIITGLLESSIESAGCPEDSQRKALGDALTRIGISAADFNSIVCGMSEKDLEDIQSFSDSNEM